MGKKRRSEPDDEEEWGAGARALAAQTAGSAGDKAKRENACRAHLRALNKQFESWVRAQIGSRPVKSWAAGCEDYLEHIAKIKADFKDVLEGESGPAAPASAAKAPPPLFGGGASGGGIPAGTPMTPNPLFGAAPSPSPSAADPSPAAAPAAPSLFSGFGAAPAPAASTTPSLFPNAASNPFAGGASAPAPSLFAPAPAAAAPTFGGFGGFGGATPSPLNTAAPDADDDDEEARPPSPSVAERERGEDDKEDALLKAPCKFFTKNGDSWGDHGKNALEFLKEKEATNGVRKARIVIRNSIGKAIVNAGVYANMTRKVQESKPKHGGAPTKNGIILTLFNAAEEEGPPVKSITLIRLSEKNTLELERLLEESVKEFNK